MEIFENVKVKESVMNVVVLSWRENVHLSDEYVCFMTFSKRGECLTYVMFITIN